MSHPDFDGGAADPAVAEEDHGVVAVEVVGTLGHARFPGLCVRCGAPADRSLRVAKLFWHDGGEDGSSYHFTGAVDAPACAGCVRTHERELRPIDPEVKRRLLRGWMIEALPFLFPLAVCTWFVFMMGPKLLEALAEGEPVEIAVWGAVCAFFGLLALMFLRLVMKGGRPMVHAPRGSAPQYAQVERGPLGSTFIAGADPTSVTRALDFTDDVSALFDGERHRFTFRNRDVAAGFMELNAHREWDPASTRAQLAARVRLGLTAAAVLAGLYLLLQELFR